MTTPRLLDLFCCAGGAAMGYHRAGFDVTGVDVKRQPNYPFRFIKTDALDILDDRHFLRTFDAVHASPPCQGYSTMTRDHSKHPRLIDDVRSILGPLDIPYVIENVQGARRWMRDPIMLCGSSFGLKVRRHRLFESNMPIVSTTCRHETETIGVYGDHPDTREYLRPDGTRRGKKARSLAEGQSAMGIDWMAWRELTEAIPPAYTEYIGRQLMNALEAAA